MKIWGVIAAGLVKRGGAVLISIRDARGSTPREAGTRMVVFGDGTFTGTIGGGTLEWRAIAEAQRMLAGGGSPRVQSPAPPPSLPSPSRREEAVPGRTISAQVTSNAQDSWESVSSQRDPSSPLEGEGREGGNHTARTLIEHPEQALITRFHDRAYALGPELGQCCGGRVTLRFEAIGNQAIEQVRQMAEREAEGAFKVVVEANDGHISRRIVTASSDSDFGDIEHYGDPMRTLLLFGAGHVGRALVLALATLPFRIIWVDARPDAFPGAVPANVTLVRPSDPVAVIASASAGSFVLIMTHSHELDLALCDAALRAGRFPYVGVIGSQTKAARFRRRLLDAGVTQTSVDELVCPIGKLGPKSKLPAVIAAATAVELLVKDEMCLKVGMGEIVDRAPATIGTAGIRTMARGQSSGR